MAWMQTLDNPCGREQPEWPGWICQGCGKTLCSPKYTVPPPCECGKSDAYVKRDTEELLDALQDMVGQHCWDDRNDSLNSFGLSANSDAMAVLAEQGRLEITQRKGRVIIGKWKKEPSERS